MVVPRHSFIPVLLNNGKVLIIGGFNGVCNIKYVELFDPATGKFTLTGSPNIKSNTDLDVDTLNSEDLSQYNCGDSFNYFPDSAALLKNGKVLVLEHPNVDLNICRGELYNPQTNKFEITGRMNNCMNFSNIINLPNGKALIAGNATFSDSDEKVAPEIYDPQTGKFTSLSMKYYKSDADPIVLKDNSIIFMHSCSKKVDIFKFK